MASPTMMQTVTDEQLGRFATLIYKRTGIVVAPQKKTLLSNRLRRRLRATGIATFDDYFKTLTTIPADHSEWDAFLQEITTHETYLYRDKSQWDWFRDVYLAEVQAQSRRGERKKALRVWSAACSTGDEACTIACCIADGLTNNEQWKIDIVGTDIGIDAVEQARQAKFGQRAIRLVPDGLRRRFFTAVDGDHWEAKPALTRWMSFSQHNLLDPLRQMPFDVVFVKNVFIYFDADSKKRAFRNIDAALRPGGMLVTGPAEGMGELLRDYQRLHPWLHVKQK
ncbi:MAG: protein-glutamate O-methyltransferase CheR [Planctomycetales bacterium]|nr:protein-glutamate O-methyltransferase CheR [Planctomycetales bacterium]